MSPQIEPITWDLVLAYTVAPMQFPSKSSSSASIQAPLLTALSIERALLDGTVREIRASRGEYAVLADRFDHHQGRIDVLLSQVER
jgi:hypothetical protein